MTSSDAAGLLVPSYGSRTLADVLPAVGAALGVDAGYPPVELALPDAPAYVVLLVDGMGAELIRSHRDHAPYLHAMLTRAGDDGLGTCGVPSTTATSLTSLGTGLPPGAHGVVGFTSRIPEGQGPKPGTLLNALQWNPDKLEPERWQPHETAFDRLGRAGVVTSVVSKREYAGSGLTRSAQRGASYVGADHVGERVAAAVAGSSYSPSLTYVYDNELDWTGHRFGVDSPAWRQQLISIDAQVEQLREALPPAVRLLVTADHGMVDATGPEDRVDVDEVEGLRDGVALLGGEARLRHVYVAPGAAEDVRETWAAQLGHRATVLLREDAVARGWFGAVEDRVLPRLGDVVVAATGSVGLFSSVDFSYETRLVGLHGSLTPTEMRVPLLLD
ncbi:alkaline phosphatase family protein [Marmoricola endophyticus]|uniref:Alkaline phosphatase family protein n=1 Tax=Marmoricola endophyticus TaxID=2040280 RepID=A0A917B9A8_9ACTN|nr:nucleotide pyrophosphatase/phosphodiesterase family protein [Marmoricola endophyticus]GGF32638.1 alkaline phosphatase family protein [Marmoricola endophyticus]